MAQTFVSPKDIVSIFQTKIIPQLLEMLSLDCENKMRQELAKATISTKTFREYVTHETKDGVSTIYVNYEELQNAEEEVGEYDPITHKMEWGRFTNTFNGAGGLRGVGLWNGELVSFQLLKWIEQGGNGYVGNQPIQATHWFANTASYIKSNLPILIKKHLKSMGFITK